MKINIQEKPKSKSFFEAVIANTTRDFSKKSFFVWSIGSILCAVISVLCISLAIIYHFADNEPVSIVGGFVGLAYLVFCFAHGLTKKGEMKVCFNLEIESLSEADPERCLDIEKWLENEEIQTFINKVVMLESRKLRNCEVESMEIFFETSQKNRTAAERQGKIDAACSKVYISPLVNPV